MAHVRQKLALYTVGRLRSRPRTQNFVKDAAPLGNILGNSDGADESAF